MTNNNICDMKPTLFLILSALLLKATPMSAQDEPQFKNAVEIAPEMYPGWNLGNTLEPGPYDWISNKLDYETVWQGTKMQGCHMAGVCVGQRALSVCRPWHILCLPAQRCRSRCAPQL